MSQGWSEWKVRQEAEERGYPTSHSQFDSYVRWGLIQPLPDGGWDPSMADRLVQIRQAEDWARPLPRRVVLLRSNFFDFPVPDEILREAMIEMASPRSISAPVRKMRVIDAAGNRWAEFIGASARAALRPNKRGRRDLPPPATWRGILRNPAVGLEAFKGQAHFAYHLNRLYTTSGLPEWPDDAGVPLEERIVMLMVLSLRRRPLQRIT